MNTKKQRLTVRNVKCLVFSVLFALTVIRASIRFALGPKQLTNIAVNEKSIHKNVTTFESIDTAVVCVVVKDDEAYIDEWVDYHYALGFSRFYVYDTSDGNEMKQWGQEKGEHVVVIHFPGENGETKAAADCITEHVNQYTWAAFFNITDFLVLKKHTDVTSFLQTHCQSGGLSINLFSFGAAARHVYSPKPVTKRFVYRQESAQEHVKFIVRLTDIDLMNDTIAFPPRLKKRREIRDTAGNLVETLINCRKPHDIAIFHRYLRSIKEQRVKMGQGIYIRNDTAHNRQDNDNHELFNSTVMDDSAWKALTMLLPQYRIHDQDLSRQAPLYASKYNDNVAVCAIIKYEEAYIDEWVDYHHALGFSHFYIYDNSPDYEMQQWASEKGDHVTVKHFPGLSMQEVAYFDCLTQFIVRKNYTWVAQFDVDEMIHLKEHDNIVDMLHDHCPTGSLSLNWVFFGPSQREVYQPLPFTQRLKYRSLSANKNVKSFARVADLDLTRLPNTHYFYLKHGLHVDVNGNNISDPYDLNPRIPENVAVFHHYYSKSYKEWIAKRMRGRAGRLHRVEKLIDLAKSRIEYESCPLYTEEGWEATKKYTPLYEQFELLENASKR